MEMRIIMRMRMILKNVELELEVHGFASHDRFTSTFPSLLTATTEKVVPKSMPRTCFRPWKPIDARYADNPTPAQAATNSHCADIFCCSSNPPDLLQENSLATTAASHSAYLLVDC